MYGYFVTGQDLNEIHSELAGNVCQDAMAVRQFYLEHSVRQCIGYDALNFDYVVFCQVYEPSLVETLICRLIVASSLRNSLLSICSQERIFSASFESDRRTFRT